MVRFRRFVFLALATLGLAAGARADAAIQFYANQYATSPDFWKLGAYTACVDGQVPSISPASEKIYSASSEGPTSRTITFNFPGHYVTNWAFCEHGFALHLKEKTGNWYSLTVNYSDLSKLTGVTSAGVDIVPLFAQMRYKLTYDAGTGGTFFPGKTPALASYWWSESIVAQPSDLCSRTGYSQTGWCADAAGTGNLISCGQSITGADLPVTNHQQTVTLYAKWQANAYNVQLVAADADPGSGHASDITVTYDQTPATIAKLPTRQYWKFDGYYTQQNGSGVKYFDADGNAMRKWQVTDVATLYAHWVRYKCTVTFLKEGPGSVNLGGSHLYDSGDVVSAKAMPDNYAVFLRWSDGEATESHSDIVVVSNATYTAYFVAKVYSLTFRYTNTKRVLVTVVQQYEHGAAVIPPDDVKPETGYSWEWNPTPPATAYQNDEFGGQYVANRYEIRFDGNGADSGSMDAIDAEYDSEDTLPPNAFVRNGYSFRGWNRNPAATEAEFSDGATVSNLSTIENDTVTLYAIWVPNSYTVRYDGNGATGGSMGDQSFTYDEAKALMAKGFTRDGQEFLHWHDTKNNADYSDGQIVSNLTTVSDEVVTLSAVWSNYHYVRFDRNGATNEAEMSLQTLSGAEVTNLYPNVYGKIGYTFAGWTTNLVDAASCRVTYTNCQAVSFPMAQPNETNDLYAVWTTNRYTIVFDPGNAPTDTTHYFFGTMDPLTNCLYDTAITIKCGWTNYCSRGLEGWSKTQGAEKADYPVRTTSPLTQGNDTIVSNLTAAADGTVKLYAVWADVGELSKAVGLTNAVLIFESVGDPERHIPPNTNVEWYPVANYTEEPGHSECLALERSKAPKKNEETGIWNLKTTVIGPGKLSYAWYREPYGDAIFKLRVDGDYLTEMEEACWAGTNVFLVGAGPHEVIWEVDGTINDGSNADKTCLDDITWIPDADYIEMNPTNLPKYATKEEAEAAATKARVAPPDAKVAAVVTSEEYDAMFAKPLRVVHDSSSGKWTLVPELTTAVSNEVHLAVEAATSNLVSQIATTGETLSVSMTMKAGLYYGLAASDAIGSIATLWPTNWMLGTGAVQELKVDRPSEDMGFFRLRVGVTPNEP